MISAEEVVVNTEAKGDDAVASEKGVTVAVDTVLTDELVQEGFARDLVRNLNEARKQAGYEISDRVHVQYEASEALGAAFTNFADYIQQETLANSLAAGNEGEHASTVKIGGEEVKLSISKA